MVPHYKEMRMFNMRRWWVATGEKGKQFASGKPVYLHRYLTDDY
jgi:hypothetical protein